MRQIQSFAWSGLGVALGLLCLLVWLLPADSQTSLRWHADLWSTQPWTLWTASLVHLSDAHLSVNLLGLLCLGIMGQHLGSNHEDALALVMAWPLSTLALLLWPQIQFYTGFSGLNHTIAALLIARGAMNWIRHRQWSWVACLLAVMLLIKLVWEAPWTLPMRKDDDLGFMVVQAAHLSGLVSGLLAFAIVQAARSFFTKTVVEKPPTNGKTMA